MTASSGRTSTLLWHSKHSAGSSTLIQRKSDLETNLVIEAYPGPWLGRFSLEYFEREAWHVVQNDVKKTDRNEGRDGDIEEERGRVI
jgi:hypothetical protein